MPSRSAKSWKYSRALAFQPAPPIIASGAAASAIIAIIACIASGQGACAGRSTRARGLASVAWLSMSSGNASTTGPGLPEIAVA